MKEQCSLTGLRQKPTTRVLTGTDVPEEGDEATLGSLSFLQGRLERKRVIGEGGSAMAEAPRTMNSVSSARKNSMMTSLVQAKWAMRSDWDVRNGDAIKGI